MERVKNLSKYLSVIILICLASIMLVACGCKKKDVEVKGFESQVQTLISDSFYVKMKQITASSENVIIREFARDKYNMIQLDTARDISTNKVLDQSIILFKGNKNYATQYKCDYKTKTYTIQNQVPTSSYIYTYDEFYKDEGTDYVNGERLDFIRYQTTPKSTTTYYREKDRVKYVVEFSPLGENIYEVQCIYNSIPQSAGFGYDIPKGYTPVN